MDSDIGNPRELSDLQKQRSLYQPELPPCLQGTRVWVEYGHTTSLDPSDADAISQCFPNTCGQSVAHFHRVTSNVPDAKIIAEHPAIRVGLVFSGRQSPGGHNVIWGLYNALKTHNQKNVLLGFLGGTEGLFTKKTLEISDDVLATYKNQGGYDLLEGTKDQIRTTEQVNAALASCNALKLDGLVIIGGVTSNNDAAQLAETFAEAKCATKVVGVPVTLNGDLKNQFVETDVGFDTICKVNSQLISNICTEALSAEKSYYFIRLMERKASHVALECTLQSHANMVILGEEVAASKLTFFNVRKQICDAVQARAEQGKYHGVILLPEGLTESFPEFYALRQEIHGLHREGVSVENIPSELSSWASELFKFLRPFITEQLLLHPESDDSAQLSQIETEKLLAHLVETEMNERLKKGTYKGKKFNTICHFFGYQARGSLPSKFDCDYGYVLGHVCYQILAAGLNGYLATVTNLKNPVSKWKCGAAPLTAMMTVKQYSCGPGTLPNEKPAIHPATVDLKGKAYELLRQNATRFWMGDIYRNPGPLQYEGPGADAKAVSLRVEDQDYMGRIKHLQEYLDETTATTVASNEEINLQEILKFDDVGAVNNLIEESPMKDDDVNTGNHGGNSISSGNRPQDIPVVEESRPPSEILHFDDVDNLNFFDMSLPFPPMLAVDYGSLEELLTKDKDDNTGNYGGNSISNDNLLQDIPVVEESRPPSNEPEVEVVGERDIAKRLIKAEERERFIIPVKLGICYNMRSRADSSSHRKCKRVSNSVYKRCSKVPKKPVKEKQKWLSELYAIPCRDYANSAKSDFHERCGADFEFCSVGGASIVKGPIYHINFKGKMSNEPKAQVMTFFAQMRCPPGSPRVVDCCVCLGPSHKLRSRDDLHGCMYCRSDVHHPVGGCKRLLMGCKDDDSRWLYGDDI